MPPSAVLPPEPAFAAAEFKTVPCYMAHILGERQFKFTFGSQTVDLLLDGFVNIVQPAEYQFTLVMLLPETLMEQGGRSMKDDFSSAD